MKQQTKALRSAWKATPLYLQLLALAGAALFVLYQAEDFGYRLGRALYHLLH